MRQRPLRIGLLVDTLVQPRWVHDVVRDIQASGIATVALVVRRSRAPAPPGDTPGRVARLWRNREALLFAYYSTLDRRRFHEEPDPFAPTDIAPLVSQCEILDVTPRETKHCDYFDDADVERIRARELDVAVRFGFRILKGRSLEVARHGVWSYHHGDNHVNRGGPAGFWEVMEGHPTTGTILQILTEELDAGRVLYRSWAATDQQSVSRNRRNIYWKSAHFLLRVLRRLYVQGPSALTEAVESSEWAPYSARLYTRPGNAEMARLLVRRAIRRLRRSAVAAVTREQWCLAYALARPGARSDGPPAPALHRTKLLVPPPDRFWADPFVVAEGDRYLVFIEEWLRSTRRAHISLLEITKDGKVSVPVPVLERDYHLSYPFVFAWQGSYFMIPETERNGTVELYRATDFPRRWELDTVLMSDVRFVDATVAEIGGRWWMFGNMVPYGASSWDELHLFHADNPRGPWLPHPRNPIKSDVRSARPAGRIFCWRGRHYRPAQDCSRGYGSAITINRIDRIDMDGYVETPVSRIEPRWRPGLTGVHTLDMAGELTVIDARLRRRRW